MGLEMMNAVLAAAAIRAGKITSEELVRACLDRVDKREAAVGAWTYLDADHALKQARSADRVRSEGKDLGPLHGIPVGIKDIFDTADMPTENDTILHAGRQPASDATAVALLREAGAVIMGKTVTTEMEVYAPGKTNNPHDLKRSPGGSSSGSAAAVADFMVPLAIGSQTNGSVIRPASYCGVYGYKPSRGRISRHGVLKQSRILDHIGVFSRTIEDTVLVAQQLMAFDSRDSDMRPQGRPNLMESIEDGPPIQPRIAFVKTPVWDQASEDAKEIFVKFSTHLSDVVTEVELPDIFANAVRWHRTIMETDLAKSFAVEYSEGKERLSPILREMIERGKTYLAVDYNLAVDGIEALNSVLNELFKIYDAILTPATTGTAPKGLESTGSPIFCTIWTLCGVPAISLPILHGSDDMPMGVQLTTAVGDDRRLLRIGRWLVNQEPFSI